MALIIPPGYYQALVPISHDRVSRPAAVTFGVGVEPGSENPTALADDVLDAFQTGFQSVFDSEVTVGPVVLTFDQGSQGRGSVSGSIQFNGNRSSATSTPSNVALLVRKTTARIGRPGRGRMFLPWVMNASAVDEVGNVTPSVVADLTARTDAFLTALETNGSPMYILHQDNVPGTTTPSLVTGLTVETKVATQRRRLRF